MIGIGPLTADALIEPLDTGDARVHLKDGTVLPCSHRQRDALRGRVGVPA